MAFRNSLKAWTIGKDLLKEKHKLAIIEERIFLREEDRETSAELKACLALIESETPPRPRARLLEQELELSKLHRQGTQWF